MSARTANILGSAIMASAVFLASLVFFVAIAHLASAQTSVPASSASIGAAFAQAAAQALVPLLVAALTALITLAPKAFAWLSAHTRIARSAWADAVKNRFLGIVEQFVLQEMQTTVDTVKNQLANQAISPASAAVTLAAVKDRVIANAKAAATAQGIVADIETAIGATSGGQSVEQFAATAVEAILAKLKLSSGAASKAVAP